MVGFVQSLAVAKRISIWTAIIMIFFLFAGAHYLNEVIVKQKDDATSGTTEHQLLSPLANDAELLVQVDGPDGENTLRQLASQRGWTVQRAFTPKDASTTDLDDYFTLDVEDVADAETILGNTAGVEYFEPNEQIQVAPIVSGMDERDPSTNNLLGIDDPFTDQQWSMRVLNMHEYYAELATSTPRKVAKIAILDTGVDARHEDLGDNYFSVDRRYDNDPMGHGTHCAGIAAGTTNNGIGIGSLAGSGNQPFVRITSIKVLNAAGMGTQKSIIAGIIEATDEGVDVISLSLGGASNGSRQKAYSKAVEYARKHGAIVIAAAGNSNMDAYNYAPANATGIITVAALDEYLQRASFSNKVNRLKRGIAAPGVAIYSTTPNGTYKSYSGTSMACPFVAGLLGVMKSIDPELQADRAYDLLHATGKDVIDGVATGRVVQPADAIRALKQAL